LTSEQAQVTTGSQWKNLESTGGRLVREKVPNIFSLNVGQETDGKKGMRVLGRDRIGI
jgi:hypothetical protein